jgi:hypothetical protein
MKKSRFLESQIMVIMKEADAGIAVGEVGKTTDKNKLLPNKNKVLEK